MGLQILIYIGVIIFHRVLTKSISNGTIENRTDSLERSFDSLVLQMNNMTDILMNLQTNIQTQKKSPLFYVELSGNRHLQTNSIVKFDTQFIDEGNNFNTGDGIFVAPTSGVYLFSWTIQTHTSKNVETELRANNIIKGKQLMGLASGAGNFGTTRNILCTVNNGDHVWIQTTNNYADNYFHDLHSGVRSSFMGLFIHEH